jgi:hypothetical protein
MSYEPPPPPPNWQFQPSNLAFTLPATQEQLAMLVNKTVLNNTYLNMNLDLSLPHEANSARTSLCFMPCGVDRWQAQFFYMYV